MELDQATRAGLGLAMNEADFVDLSFDPALGLATATLRLPTLADAANERLRTVQFVLHPVARVVASLRQRVRPWDDAGSTVVPIAFADLPDVVRSFGGQPIYGCEFFDVHETEQEHWLGRESLDWKKGDGAAPHSLTLFQESVDRQLDVCLWFRDLELLDDRGFRIQPERLAAAGVAFWKAFHRRDARTEGLGLFPLGSPTEPRIG